MSGSCTSVLGGTSQSVDEMSRFLQFVDGRVQPSMRSSLHGLGLEDIPSDALQWLMYIWRCRASDDQVDC